MLSDPYKGRQDLETVYEAGESSHTSLHNRVVFDSSAFRSIGQFCSWYYTSRAQKNWTLPPALLHVHPDLRQIFKSVSCSVCQIAETQHSYGRWAHYEGQAAVLGYREQHTLLGWQPSTVMRLRNMSWLSPFCEMSLCKIGKGNTWELGMRVTRIVIRIDALVWRLLHQWW